MAQPKTVRNDGDVDAFLGSVENERRRNDALEMRDLMATITGEEPHMWGDAIVGYGPYLYTPASGGQAHEWFKTGFSPRKAALTLYLMDGFDGYTDLLGRLGPHSTGRSCLYVKDLSKVDRDVLTELISRSVAAVEAGLESG